LEPDGLTHYLKEAWNHDPHTTLKLIFNLGLVNEDCFMDALLWLNDYHSKTLALNLQGFSQFGYLDLLPELLYLIMKNHEAEMIESEYNSQNKKRKKMKLSQLTWVERASHIYESNLDYRYLYNRVVDLFAKLLKSDIEYLKLGEIEKISMASRWCTHLDKLHDKWTPLFEGIARLIFPRDSDPEYKDIEEAQYVCRVQDRFRKEVLVPLRRALSRAKKWNPVRRKPAVSNTTKKLYLKTFDHNGSFSELYHKKYNVYLEFTTNWEKESRVLLPNQIVANLNNGSGSEVMECERQRLVRHLEKNGSLRNCLAICDTSKMIGATEMGMCVSLGLLISELSDEPWKGKVITCSQNPKLCRIEGDNLQSMIEYMKGLECDGDIDCHKVFDLILEVAVAEKLSQDRMVKTIFVFSDMGFKQAGYKILPEIVFWNVRDSASRVVERKREGVAMVGGVSEGSLTALLEENVVSSLENLVKSVPKPEEFMESAISGEDYNDLVVFD
jgi:hypothetical protein